MLKIGEKINAVVTRVEPYGVFLVYNDDEIFVPLNNLAWIPSPTTITSIRTGDSIKVLVESLNEAENTYTGSLKRLFPEQNPYKRLEDVAPSDVLHGVVRMVHQHGVSVELDNRCIGEISLSDHTVGLQEGVMVSVRIAEVDVENQRLSLELADKG